MTPAQVWKNLPQKFYVIRWQDRLDPKYTGYLGEGGSDPEFEPFGLIPFTSQDEAEKFLKRSNLGDRQICTILSWKLEQQKA